MRTTHALRRHAGLPYAQRGWSTPRVLLMLAVEELGAPRMGDLKRRLGVTGRAITSLVDSLDEEGLVVRRPDPTDRRSTRLEMTALGREHLTQIKELHEAHSERTFSVLSRTERLVLLDLLERLGDHVRGETAQLQGDRAGAAEDWPDTEEETRE